MGEQGLLSYVKKVIHSLIVSTPDRMSVERLKRDYANEEGSTVPFTKLGFKDIESFLRSIPDTVMLLGCGPMAEVLARTHPKTAHIQNLVQCQKKPSSKARARKRSKPKFGCPSERSDLVFVNEQPKRSYANNNNKHSSNRCNSSSYNYNAQHERQTPVFAHQQLEKETSSVINSFAKFTIANADDDESSGEINNLEIYVSDGEIETKSNECSKLPVCLNKQALVDINKKVEFNVSCIEYQSSYEGCDEDEGMIPAYAVDKRVLNYKYAKDSIVAPKMQPELEKPQVEYLSSDEGSETDAIPAYAVDDRVMSLEYPKDVFRFDQQLPQRDIHKKFIVGDRIELQLVTVANPHCFNFWIHDEEFESYKNMSDSMQRFYNNIHEIKSTIPLFLIMVGHLGAVQFKGKFWQRARVLSFKTGNRKNIEVEFVDTGERAWICHSDLKYLYKEFATLPPQFWAGRLACVMPRQGPCFSVEASNYFYDLVCYRRLFAKIEKINDIDNIVYMVLVDPDAESSAQNINVALIESGWVRRSYNP